jgi:hypothetical protein
MRTSSEEITGKSGGRWSEMARLFRPRLIELWIFTAIAIFFLIRVLGSRAAQRLLNDVGLRHFQ